MRIQHQSIFPKGSFTYPGPVLVNRVGIPVYWGNLYCSYELASNASNTAIKQLQAIRELYSLSEGIYPDEHLDEMISNWNFEKIKGLLQSYLIRLINKSPRSQNDERKWRASLRFIEETLANNANSLKSLNKFKKIKSELIRIQYSYKQLHVHRDFEPVNVRAFPSYIVDYLLERLSPDSVSHPFVERISVWNSYLIFVMLLYLGLRAGELLSLTVDCVKHQYDKKLLKTRYWINVTNLSDSFNYEDPRTPPPSANKTRESKRQVPVPEEVAKLINAYIINIRGKQKHPLLLRSIKNRPLSQRGLNEYFSIIEQCMPKNILNDMRNEIGHSDIQPHGLRHTAAVAVLSTFIQDGVAMDVAFALMRRMFGWTVKSSMPERYSQAYFASEVSKIWMHNSDIRADKIRKMSEKCK